MITSHAFAKELLEGPDLPIVLPLPSEKCMDENNTFTDPVVSLRSGKNTDDEDGPEVELLEIGYKSKS